MRISPSNRLPELTLALGLAMLGVSAVFFYNGLVKQLFDAFRDLYEVLRLMLFVITIGGIELPKPSPKRNATSFSNELDWFGIIGAALVVIAVIMLIVRSKQAANKA